MLVDAWAHHLRFCLLCAVLPPPPKKSKIGHFPHFTNSAIWCAAHTFKCRRGVEVSWRRRKQQQRSRPRRRSSRRFM